MRPIKFLAGCLWRDAGKMTRFWSLLTLAIPSVIAATGYQQNFITGTTTLWIFSLACLGMLTISMGARAYGLERGREAKITISDAVETTLPKSGTDQLTRYISIEIENVSYEEIQNCVVKETRLTNNQDITAEITGRIFRQSRERYADAESHEYIRSFNLKGFGDKERIDIADLDERVDSSRVVMAYATTKTGKTLNAIPRHLFPHVLTVQVSASNLQVPIKKTFKLLVDLNGHLKMETKF